jgi:hypothetical protein
MLQRALASAGDEITRLLSTNSNVPLNATLTTLTTDMIRLLERRLEAVAAPPEKTP